MEQALLFFDFSKNIEQDVYHNGEQKFVEESSNIVTWKILIEKRG